MFTRRIRHTTKIPQSAGESNVKSCPHGRQHSKGGCALIEISHLSKVYGNHLALDDLSVTVEQGKIYGFLGPNGAGKSTTMNIVAGCLSATGGNVRICGYDILSQPMEAKKRIGYLPEIPPLYPDMTPLEYLNFVADVKEIPARERYYEVCLAMEKTGITHMSRRLIRNLSKGYRQRVGLSCALLGEPEVIILDEPTVGLDPIQIVEMRSLIASLADDHTVILSSHILPEVSAVCDRVLIMNKGRLIANDTPDNLSRLLGRTRSVSMTLMADEAACRAALAGVGAHRLEFERREDGHTGVLAESAAAEDLRERIALALAGAQIPVLAMAGGGSGSLEDIFLTLTQTEEGGEQDQ